MRIRECFLARRARAMLLIYLMVWSPVLLKGQTMDPAPLDLNTEDYDVLVAHDAAEPDMLLGWNWGDRPVKELSEALKMNAYHGSAGILGYGVSEAEAVPNMQMFFCAQETYPKHYSGNTIHWKGFTGFNYNTPTAIQALAMHYSAAMETDETTQGGLDISTGSIGEGFGFTTKHEDAVSETNPNNADQRWLALRNAAINGNNTRVLADPWPSDQFFRFKYTEAEGDDEAQGHSDGRYWNVTVNLRRLAGDAGLSDDEAVLKIRVSNADYGDIRFYEIPEDDNGEVELDNNRGKIWTRKNIGWGQNGLPNDVRELVVTRKMLPQLSNTTPDISVSAAFRLEAFNLDDLNTTPEFPRPKNPPLPIKSIHEAQPGDLTGPLNIEVFYTGAADVGVNWVRLETPHAQDLFRGLYDDDIKTILNDQALKRVHDQNQLGGESGKILRFYGIDEARPIQWQALRYANQLTNGRLAVELGTGAKIEGEEVNLLSHFQRIVGLKEMWTGGVQFGNRTAAAFNFNAQGDAGRNNLGYQSAFTHNLHPLAASAPLTHYEVGFHVESNENGLATWINGPIDDELYDHYLEEMVPFSVQSTWEQHLVGLFFKRPEFMFETDRWLYNPWIFHEWQPNSVPERQKYQSDEEYQEALAQAEVHMSSHHRPKTAEEIRLQLSTAFLAGCKGLMYFRGAGDDLTAGTMAQFGFSDIDELSGTPVANRDLLADEDVFGSEFLTLKLNEEDSGNLAHFIKSENFLDIRINLLGSRDYTGDGDFDDDIDIDNDQLYLGRLSMRLVAYDIHDWLHTTAYDDSEITVAKLLMGMQLGAWYAKGFRQTPIMNARSETIQQEFEDLINLDGVAADFIDDRVRDEYAPDNNGSSARISKDRFFDITLLQEKVASPPDAPQVYYVGVVNRLTNPIVLSDADMGAVDPIKLIQPGQPGSNGANHPAYFVSYDQMEKLTDDENGQPVLDEYAQIGSREITLPFHFHHQNGYALIKVTELGAGEDAFNQVVGQDKSVTMKFKPGEGKLLRIEILPPDLTNNPNGELPYANQRKMVLRSQDLNGGRIHQYLSVYQRSVNGKDQVFFRCSEQVQLDGSGLNSEFEHSSHAGLEWEDNEISLSNEIYYNGVLIPSGDIFGCSHPAIVYRSDAADPNQAGKVYVVYAVTTSHSPPNSMFIVENIFSPDATQSAGNVLAIAYGSDRDTWGTPVISAADSFNYYAWADDLNGICVGVKGIDDSVLKPVTIGVRAIGNGDPAFRSIARHPALITYVRTSEGEKETALVWQEGNNPGLFTSDASDIFYTRIEYNGSTIVNFLANGQFEFATASSNPQLVNGGTIMNLSSEIEDPQQTGCPEDRLFVAPVIQRDQVQGRTVSYAINDFFQPFESVTGNFSSDLVSWGKNGQEGASQRMFFRKLSFIDYTDQSNIPRTRFYVNNIGTITEVKSALAGGADLTQGTSDVKLFDWGQGPLGPFNFSSSNFILNFQTDRNTLKYGRHIELGNTSSSFELSGANFSTWMNKSYIRLPQGGVESVQLCARENPESVTSNYSHVRRLIARDDNDDIVADSRFFYKTGGVEEQILVGPGCRNFCNTYIVFGPKMKPDGTVDIVPLRFTASQPTLSTMTAHGSPLHDPDVLTTEWFDLNNGDIISFNVMGSQPGCMKMRLRRQDDMSHVNVNLPAAADDKATEVEYEVQNPAPTMYRLEAVFNETGVNTYSENFIAGEYELEAAAYTAMLKDGLLQDGKIYQPYTLDLGHSTEREHGLELSLAPNPARDLVTISVRDLLKDRSSSLKLSISDATGREVFSQSVNNASDQLTIDTSDWSVGMYVLRLTRSGLSAAVLQSSFVVVK